jgi:hypothetical protein
LDEVTEEPMMREQELMAQEKLVFATGMFKLLGHPLRLRIVELLDLHTEKS